MGGLSSKVAADMGGLSSKVDERVNGMERVVTTAIGGMEKLAEAKAKSEAQAVLNAFKVSIAGGRASK